MKIFKIKKLAIYLIISLISQLFLTSSLSYAGNSFSDDQFDIGVLSPTNEANPSYFEGDANTNISEDIDSNTDFDNLSPIEKFIVNIINFVTRVIGSLAIIIFIIAGFKFMAAQGNDTAIGEAKEILKYGVMGLVVTFISYTLVIFIQTLFNRG